MSGLVERVIEPPSLRRRRRRRRRRRERRKKERERERERSRCRNQNIDKKTTRKEKNEKERRRTYRGVDPPSVVRFKSTSTTLFRTCEIISARPAYAAM